MADAIITLTIPEEEAQRVINAINDLYFIPIERDKDGIPLLTDAEWIKNALKEVVIKLVQKHETLVARDLATVEADYDIIS